MHWPDGHFFNCATGEIGGFWIEGAFLSLPLKTFSHCERHTGTEPNWKNRLTFPKLTHTGTLFTEKKGIYYLNYLPPFFFSEEKIELNLS